MNKNYFLLLLLLLLNKTDGRAQHFLCVDTLIPYNYEVNSISVVDDQVIWAVASQTNLLETASDHILKVLKTVNGGKQWDVFDVEEAKGRLSYCLEGRSSTEAWISTNDIGGGAGKGLMRTQDGGGTWNVMLNHRAGGALFHLFDERHIYCQNGYYAAASDDGGESWKFDTLAFAWDEYFAVRSGNNNIGVAGDTTWVGTSRGRIIRCTDFGRNCEFLNDTVNELFFVSSLTFLNSQLGFLTSSCVRTQDGGLSWTVLPFPANPYLSTRVNLIESSKKGKDLWIIMDQSSTSLLLHSIDLGQTWTLQSIPGMINSMDCGPNDQLWVALRSNPRKYLEHYTKKAIQYTNRYSDIRDGAYAFFMFAESIKSFSLLKGIQQISSLKSANLPITAIKQEEKLRDSLVRTQVVLHQLIGQSPEKEALKRKVRQLESEHQALIHRLDSICPEFQRRRIQMNALYVEELRDSILAPGQMLLQYLLTDSSIYIIAVNKDTLAMHIIPRDFPLDQWISDLRSSLTAFYSDPNMANSYDSLAMAYTDVAYRLYEKLLMPFADKLPETLIIVPDGVLGYLPFEVLLTEQSMARATQWQLHPYLLKRHRVSYDFSATMLREMMLHPHLQEPTANFYGFAPRYEGDSSLLATLFSPDDLRKNRSALPFTGEEVYKTAKIMNGQYFTGTQATAARFRQKASDARILHLATHGRSNEQEGDFCFLVFSPNKDNDEDELLYARDIYNLQINADLVTLSACETGIGELQNGEGIISLARAFAYAGAKSIVTSLWSVSDAKTKDLMVDFYKNLRKGQDKDEALRQAKLAFLKRNKGLAAHPFFWAGFVGIGDMRALRVR